MTAHSYAKIALALSGGGFRATLFHLGVIRCLRERGLLNGPAGRIDTISSVSGGSILAAHLCLNWPRYTSRHDAVFEDAAEELLYFTQRDVRGHIVTRAPLMALIHYSLLLPRLTVRALVKWRHWHAAGRLLKVDRLTSPALWFLVEQLQELFSYSDMYAGRGTTVSGTLQCLDPRRDALHPPPRLFIAATNLTEGVPCAFTHDGFVTFSASSPPQWAPGLQSLPIAHAVAASTAFPGFFAPLEVLRPLQGWSFEADSEFIADGGILDNTGLDVLRRVRATDTCYTIISDASADLHRRDLTRYRWSFAATGRVIDLVASTVRQHITAPSVAAGGEIHVPIGHHNPEQDVAASARQLLPFLRTDLDRFNDTEVVRLVEHGYYAASERLRDKGIDGHRPGAWVGRWPGGLRLSEPMEAEQLEKGNLRAWLTPAYQREPMVLLYAMLIVLALALGWRRHSDARTAAWQEEATVLAGLRLSSLPSDEVPDAPEPIKLPIADHVPDYHVTVVEDVRIFDLRLLPATPSRDKPSTVVVERMVQLSAAGSDLSSEPPRQTLCMPFACTGTDLKVWSPTLEIHLPAGSQDTRGSIRTYVVQRVSTTGTKLLYQFLTTVPGYHPVTSAKAWMRGAFDAPEQRWAGALIAPGCGQAVKLLLLLPPHIAPASLRRRVQAMNAAYTHDASNVGLLASDSDGRWLAWKITEPQTNMVYRLEW